MEEVALRVPVGLDLDGTAWVRGMVRGVPATVLYRLDQTEMERRAGAGSGPVPSLEGLDVLMQLPLGLPVPRSVLPSADRRVLERLPDGCVEFAGDDVVRRATRPLAVEAAAVSHRQWRRGLERAGVFGAYCTRLLALRGVPEDLAEAQVWAGYYGVGLVVRDGAHAVVVTEPKVFRPECVTAAGWLFTEQVLALALTAGQVPTG
ncbi:hypothetical protein ACQEU3_34675 [Spirillospora sp. CA-253888]